MQANIFGTRKYYISSTEGRSGISKYSRDFYQLVLKEKGYIFVDSNQPIPSILSVISSRDHVHIELGIFQKREIEILFTMLKANYKSVSVTLHDAPLFKYPFYEFKNPLLNKLSKVVDKYANSFGAILPYIKKLKAIYVLSQKGLGAVRKKYGVENVYYLPHVIDLAEGFELNGKGPGHFIYFGFIGRNKGIEYALQLHQQIIRLYPELEFYVVGKPMGKERKYYDSLRGKYKENVNYLGYVPDEQLHDIFRRATFALLPFKDYKFYWPMSGSVLYSLKKGKILLTNKVNTVSEVIEHGKNGIYLSGKLKKDMETITALLKDKQMQADMKAEARNYLRLHHSAEVVQSKLID